MGSDQAQDSKKMELSLKDLIEVGQLHYPQIKRDLDRKISKILLLKTILIK